MRSPTKVPLLMCLLALLLTSGAWAAPARKWTLNQGNPIEAEFVRIHEGQAILKLKKGSKIQPVPLQSLSPDDLKYIREELERTGKTEQLQALQNMATTAAGAGGQLPAGAMPGQNPMTSGPMPGAVATPEQRMWTDTQGRTLKAKFVRLDGENVMLTREDGKDFKVPLAKFSQPDQDYVRQQTSPMMPGTGSAMPPGGASYAPPGSPGSGTTSGPPSAGSGYAGSMPPAGSGASSTPPPGGTPYVPPDSSGNPPAGSGASSTPPPGGTPYVPPDSSGSTPSPGSASSASPGSGSMPPGSGSSSSAPPGSGSMPAGSGSGSSAPQGSGGMPAGSSPSMGPSGSSSAAASGPPPGMTGGSGSAPAGAMPSSGSSGSSGYMPSSGSSPQMASAAPIASTPAAASAPSGWGTLTLVLAAVIAAGISGAGGWFAARQVYQQPARRR